MKKNLILAGAAILGLLFTACNKEDGETVTTTDGNKAITVTITGLNLTTKTSAITSDGVDTWADGGTSGTAGIASFDIYFTDGSGDILYAYHTSSADDITALTSTGIRFINLENVSAVYVTANASESNQLSSGNVSAIYETLDNQAPFTTSGTENPKTAILYIGADLSLSLENEVATASTTYAPAEWTNDSGTDPSDTNWDDASNWQTSTEDYSPASQYYLAYLYVRPIISRLEMNKIQAAQTGSYGTSGEPKTATVNNQAYEYYVTWSGFQPDFKGVYMSNFYGTIYPVEPSLPASDRFGTPSGDKVDTGTEANSYNDGTYLWSSDTGINSTYNKDGISLYANGGSNLFDGSTSGSYFVYFNGSSNSPVSCVPFNFFVSFAVDDMTYTPAADATTMLAEPRYHFLFNTAALDLSSYTYTLHVNDNGTWRTVDNNTSYFSGSAADDAALYAALASDFSFSDVTDDNYYANIQSLQDENGDTIKIAPNTIYKLSEVTINPYNLTTSTIDEDKYNVVVRAVVVPYAVKNVTAVFDKE